MAGGARHGWAERARWLRRAVDQLRLPRHRPGLGDRQGDPRLGSLHGTVRHGGGIAAARWRRRQGRAAPDHPRLPHRDGRRHVRRGSRARGRGPPALAAPHRARDRRHPGRDQRRRRGVLQSTLAQPGHGADGHRLSAGRSDRWAHRAETAGERGLAHGIRRRRLGDGCLPAHRVVAGARIGGVSRPAPRSRCARADQSHSRALRSRRREHTQRATPAG